MAVKRVATVLVLSMLLAARGDMFGADALKPNVIFILADDLGARDTSLYGSLFCDTPNIERLGARGVRFTNAYAANPLCSPTRSSILAGQYPARIGITAPVCHVPRANLKKGLVAKAAAASRALIADSVTRLDTSYFTLAEALKEAGYATGHFGKWHLGPEPYSPLQQGFDVDVPHTPGPGPGGGYLAPWKFAPKLAPTAKPGDHIEDRMALEARAFMRAHKDRPFYLNYWAFSVHSPWQGKPEYVEAYARKAKPESAQRNPVYGAMVKSLDDAVGRLLDAVDELKIAERTIMVFFSDNGGCAWPAEAPAFEARFVGIPITSNAPLRSGKASIYEGGTRVPCVVIWPGKTRAGAVSDALLSSVDFYPTLLEMCGVARRPGLLLDGVSQVPALLGQGAPRDKVFCHFPHGSDAQSVRIPGFRPSTYVRRGDWKLIRFHCDNADQTDRLELYNLKDDPGETRDLAAAKPDVAKELDALIAEFLRETDAVVPEKNPAYKPGAKAKAAAGE